MGQLSSCQRMFNVVLFILRAYETCSTGSCSRGGHGIGASGQAAGRRGRCVGGQEDGALLARRDGGARCPERRLGEDESRGPAGWRVSEAAVSSTTEQRTLCTDVLLSPSIGPSHRCISPGALACPTCWANHPTPAPAALYLAGTRYRPLVPRPSPAPVRSHSYCKYWVLSMYKYYICTQSPCTQVLRYPDPVPRPPGPHHSSGRQAVRTTLKYVSWSQQS